MTTSKGQMNMKTKLLMAAIVAGLAASAVQADGGMGRHGGGMGPMGGQPPMDFSVMDQNGDGAVTLEELQSLPQSHFAAADSNGDGGLSAEELAAQMVSRMQSRMAHMIERFDANGDGLLQADEMPMPRGNMPFERMFEHVDTDGDGQITEAEFDAAAEKRGGRMGHGGKGGHGHGHGHGHGDSDDHDG
jgi:hypothetical protein